MSERRAGDDLDPSEWSNPTATYDRVAPLYAEAFGDELNDKPFDRDLLIRFAEATRPRASAVGPVCDLGCGPGQIGAFLAEHGVEVMGIDLSEGMVAQARRCSPNLTFAQGDMTKLALSDGALTGIACFYALIHLPRVVVPVALAEMRRVLAERGDLLLAVHGGQGTLHAEEMLGQPAELDATLFLLPELRQLIEHAGFKVVEAHERAPYPREHPTPRLYVWATRRA
jgi:SAM-dependent methyltransferase